jgi:serine/threonine-protein kinase
MDTRNFDEYYKIDEMIDGYLIRKIVGEGRYGIVYLAEDKNKDKFIIKQLKSEMLKQTQKKLFYEETILRSLDYPYFPKFISKFEDHTRQGYIMEFIEGTVMEDLLMESRYEFGKDEIYKIGGQLLELIEVLHHHNIVHRDIRLPNVIQRDNKELVLIDFGLARYIDNKRYVKEMDYWFLGDFLIHLYYSAYQDTGKPERPWFEEQDLNMEEKILLKKLMGIESSYHNMEEIKEQLEKVKNTN